MKLREAEKAFHQKAYLNLLMAGNSNPPDVSRKSHWAGEKNVVSYEQILLKKTKINFLIMSAALGL